MAAPAPGAAVVPTRCHLGVAPVSPRCRPAADPLSPRCRLGTARCRPVPRPRPRPQSTVPTAQGRTTPRT